MKRWLCLLLCICMVTVIFTPSILAEESEKQTTGTALALMNSEGFALPLTTEAAFWNSSGYQEYMVPDKNLLGIDVRLTNDSEAAETIQPYFALYEKGRLIEVERLAPKTVAAGETTNYSDTFSINGNQTESYTVKVFHWTDGILKPFGEAAAISGTKADFYGNSLADATFIHDFSKEINGSVNAANDVDYLKIIPEATATYALSCFSTSGVVATLYNSSGAALVSNSAAITYSLVAGNLYYIKLTNAGAVGDYVFAIGKAPSSEAAAFDVYKFDVDVNVYKKSILEICDDLYYEDEALSKQMYEEYEAILDDDAKLHALPDFLADHPKELANFDDLLNEYYGTKYDDFEEIKQRYIDLIDKYTELPENLTTSTDDTEAANAEQMTETGEILYPIIRKFTPPAIQGELGTGPINPGDEIQQTPATPSLTITSTTETSITYDAVFPVSGRWGNCIYMYDFNTDDGLITWENVYGTDMNRANGQYTISGLSPGGIYVVVMMWSDDGLTFEEENPIHRFVQLPDNTTENLKLYTGGRVTARLEAADKALASNADFNTWLDRMDDVYYAYKELTGYTPYNSKKIEMRSTRDNLNEEFDMVDGENYYWIVYGYFDGTNIFKYGRAYYKGLMRRLSKGDWGWLPMHEMSHVFDNYKWNFDSETLAQFKAYFAMEQLNAKIYDCVENEDVLWYTGAEYYDYLKYNRFMQSYSNSFGEGFYASEGFAALLIDIQKEIGWEPFKKTFRYFSSLSSSQVPYDEGEILKLFLTKLKDYSGEDVLGMINSRDTGIIEDWYGITLEYVEPIYPTVSGGGSSGGGSSTVTVDKGSYSTHQFTPTESANYYIYTSPYGGSGVSNDTYIEVYNNASLSGTPIASNDDYDGGRFSKVSVAMTEGTTYYVKVRHYNNGQIHAELNITKNVPVVELSLDDYEDVIVASGEYALYSFTPTRSMTHVFEVENYNGGSLAYATYIKLYDNESMTQRIGHNSKKIIVNLTAGNTYYLQFSGFLMKYSRGRISVKEGQTIEFTKSTDSSFIYVNSPEYLTRFDMVDDPDSDHRKIFEQQNVTGKNTFYETHVAWWGDDPETYEPTASVYVDVDFYNPTDSDITVSISNLAYGTEYSVIANYYNGGGTSVDITIPAQEHRLLFETLNTPLELSYPGEAVDGDGWDWNRHRSPVILFDFAVTTGNVVISSLAAYNRSNLYLKNGYKNILDSSGEAIDSGEVIYNLTDRLNEADLAGKYKGIAQEQSAWIDANLEIALDDSTSSGQPIQVNLQDEAYPNGVANPKTWWMTNINPLNDEWNGLLFAMPGNEHRFTYHRDVGGVWNFAYDYHDIRDINVDASGNASINNPVPDYILSNAALDVASGSKEHFTGAPDELSCGMGAWGATYHYTVTIANNTSSEKTISYQAKTFDNMIFGYKSLGETNYTTQFISSAGNEDSDWLSLKTVTIPSNTIVELEFVVLLGGGHGGTNNRIILN